MPRPEFPIGVILPVACIRAIRAEQEAYDRDPEEYERREHIKEEMRQEEKRQLAEWSRLYDC